MNGVDEVPNDTMTYATKSFWPGAPAAEAVPDTARAELPTSRAHQVSSQIGKHIGALVRQGRPLKAVLHALCLFFEGTFSGYTSMVLLLDSAGERVEAALGSGVDVDFASRLHGRTASEVEEIRLPGLRLCQAVLVQTFPGEVLAIFAVYREEGRDTPPRGLYAAIERFSQVAAAAIERIRHDEALMRTEALLRAAQLLSSTYCFSWSTKADEFICSTELQQLYGFGTEASSVTLGEIRTRIFPEDVPSFHEAIDRARSGKSAFEHEHRLRMPDNSVKYLHLVAHGTRDRDGSQEYIGAIQDVTHRKRTQETLVSLRAELAESERLAGLVVLSAAIAHEVNQPLSGIVTNAHTCRRMLSSDTPNIRGALETARRTIRDAERACEVIKRIRTLFGGNAAARDSIDLNEAVCEVIALSQSDIQRNRVTIYTDFGTELPQIRGDRVQIQQVVLNLLSNASEAMREVEDRVRALTIRTALEERRFVRLSVQDVGHGIEPDKVDRLFDAFYTTKADGMGIGLCISQSIIERHQGKLWVVPNDGPGVTVSFVVPLDYQAGVDFDVPRLYFGAPRANPASRPA